MKTEKLENEKMISKETVYTLIDSLSEKYYDLWRSDRFDCSVPDAKTGFLAAVLVLNELKDCLEKGS